MTSEFNYHQYYRKNAPNPYYHHHHHHRRTWKNTLFGKVVISITTVVAILALSVMLLAVIHPQALTWLNSNLISPMGDGIRLLSTNNKHLKLDYDGIDVSHHQGIIDWDKVAKDTCVKFVYIKATEGNDYVDEYYERNVAGATKAGIPLGSYHYLTSRSSLAAQAANFARTANPKRQQLRPMVDIEEEGVKGWTSSQIADSLEAFVKLVHQYYNIWPVIYSYTHFYKENLAPRFNEFHLFLARYEEEAPLVKGALRHSLWQHTDQGVVDGVPKPVDLDVFFPEATLDDLLYPEELK